MYYKYKSISKPIMHILKINLSYRSCVYLCISVCDWPIIIIVQTKKKKLFINCRVHSQCNIYNIYIPLTVAKQQKYTNQNLYYACKTNQSTVRAYNFVLDGHLNVTTATIPTKNGIKQADDRDRAIETERI